MTQLEEYLERRKLLQQRMSEARGVAFDREASTESRREANRKFNQYSEMLYELDEQIRALDPNALPPSRRKVRKGCASLNQPIASGNELGTIIPAVLPEDPVEQTDESPTIELWKKRLGVAARHLPPRQAEALDLRYNGGYSLEMVAETMGISVKTAHQNIKKASKKLEDWMLLVIAAGKCTVSEHVFRFEEFFALAPHAFPQSLWKIILTLYHAPEEFPTMSVLAKAQGRNYMQLSRQLGWIRALCEQYGIPLNACHPLIRNSRNRNNKASAAFHQFDGFRKSTYSCRYRHDDAQKNFAAREALIRYSSVEDAVRGALKDAYGVEDAPDGWIAEGLELFDGERLRLARRRIDGGETLAEVRGADVNGHAVKQIKSVVRVTALYVYFRLDCRRVCRQPDLWEQLLVRWQCFPARQEETLRLLLAYPGIRQLNALAARLGVAECPALRLVRKLAWYAQWWDIPRDALPELVRLHMEDGVEITRNANTFQRAVKLRHDPLGREPVFDDGS